jgi:ribonuclease P protein component
MLSKSHRIPSSAINHIMRFGKRVTGKEINLIYDSRYHGQNSVQDSRNQLSRFSFVVSTKVDKRATQRNRIRRLMSEAVRLRMDEIKPGFDCIFIAKKGLQQKDIEKIVLNQLHEAHIS